MRESGLRAPRVWGTGSCPFFDKQMCIDSTEAEPADRGAPGSVDAAGWPGFGRGEHAERASLQLERRRGLREVGGGRKHAMLESQQDLEQARRPRGRERMAHVRLDRPDHALARPPAGIAIAPESLQALGLDRIADRSARRVAFDQVNLVWRPAGLLVRRAHGPKLALGAGREQVSMNVVGQTDPANQAVDHVAMPDRVIEPLEHEQSCPFAHDQPVGQRVERCGFAPGREGTQLRETHLRVERIGPRDSAREHDIGPSRAQFIDRQLEGVKRRGAGGIERERRASQSQGLCHEGRGQAGWKGVERVGRLGLVRSGRPSRSSITVPRISLEYSDDFSVGSTMLPKTTPARSEVDLTRAGRSPGQDRRVQGKMEDRIEPVQERGVDVQSRELGLKWPDETPARGVNLIGSSDRRVERLVRCQCPAAGGNLGGRVDGSVDVGPEGGQVVGAAGKDRTVAHDGDGERVVWVHDHTSPGSLKSGQLQGELTDCGETPG